MNYYKKMSKKELIQEIQELMDLHDYVMREYPNAFNSWYENQGHKFYDQKHSDEPLRARRNSSIEESMYNNKIKFMKKLIYEFSYKLLVLYSYLIGILALLGIVYMSYGVFVKGITI